MATKKRAVTKSPRKKKKAVLASTETAKKAESVTPTSDEPTEEQKREVAAISVQDAVEKEDLPTAEPESEPPAAEPAEEVSPTAVPESEPPASETPAPEPAKPSEPEPQASANPPAFKSKPVKRLKFKREIIIYGLALILALAGIYSLIHPAHTNPLPQPVKQAAKFPVYYPQSTTTGYNFLAGSSDYTAGKLTYSVGSGNAGDGGPYIRVSEQALSGQGPDLTKLPGFFTFQAPAGKAAVGTSGDVINAVLVTKKTIIILNGLNGVSQHDLTQVVNSMKS